MKVIISDLFDLQKIVDSGQCFRCRRVGEDYLFLTGRRCLLIRRLTPKTYEVSCTRSEWRSVWRPYFDLDFCYGELGRGIPETGFFAEAAAAAAGVRVLRQDPWETLLSFILSQRKTIPAIRSCVEALSSRFGEKIDSPVGELSLFPTAGALASASPEELAACGLGYRLPYVQGASKLIATGKLRLRALRSLPDGELTQALLQVPGVGIKVANCVTLFAYHRTASVPIDTWIQKLIDERFGGVNPFPDFGEEAGIWQQYAFYYLIQNKSLLR